MVGVWFGLMMVEGDGGAVGTVGVAAKVGELLVDVGSKDEMCEGLR